MFISSLRNLPEKQKSRFADLVIFLCAVTWGGDYIATKLTLQDISPMYLLGLRFSAAFIIMALIFRKRFRGITGRTFFAGLLIGVFMTGAYISLTIGLQSATAGKSAFITSSYAVFVPLMLWVVHRKFPGWSAVIGVIVCIAGVALLSLNEKLSVSRGDILIILCAVLFAANIVAISYFVRTIDPIDITLIETGTAAAAAMCFALLFEGSFPRFETTSFFGLLYLIILGTIGTHLLSNIALKYTSPVKATILFTLESPFAAFFAFLVFGDRFTGRMVLGCALIVLAVFITELGPLVLNGRTKPHAPGRTDCIDF